MDGSDIRVGAIPQRQGGVVGAGYFGQTGAGKTNLVKKHWLDVHDLLQPSVGLDTGDGMADYLRAKGDPRNPVTEVDFYHVGGAGIDLPAMLRTQTDRWRLARRLSPREKGNPNTYFDDAVALVLMAALCVLGHLSKRGYHLADLVRIAKRPALLSLLCRLVPGLDDPFGDVRGDPKTLANILSSLRTRLADVEIVAALMLHCARFVNLNDPVGTNVVRWSDRHAVALEGLLGFALDTSVIYRLSHRPLERVTYFMDEVRSIAPLQSIGAACRRGRKHKVSVVLSVHEPSGMHALYGKDEAEELLGLLGHKVFVRQGSPAAARWASDYLGSVESVENLAPHPTNKGGVARRVTDRPNVHWDELRRVALPNAETDEMHLFVDFPDVTCEVVSPWLKDASLPPGHKTPALVERPAACEVMPDMTVADLHRLGLPVSKPYEDALKA